MDNQASEMTFDEFRSARARDRSRMERDGVENPEKLSTKAAKAAAEKTGIKAATGATSQAANGKKLASNKSGSLGEFLEMPQFQAFVAFIIVLDCFAVMAALLLGNHIAALDASGTTTEEISVFFGIISLHALHEGLLAFASFSLVFFSFEVGLVLFAFRSATVGQWGYVLDGAVISYQVYCELGGLGLTCHLLNFVRFWRILRLHAFLVSQETAKHDITTAELTESEANVRKLEGECKRAKLDIQREIEAREAVDEMLSNMKEEVDTLNEALKIAAMDIAEVGEADDDLLSSEDEEDDIPSSLAVDDEGFSDAPGSMRDKAMNKASLLREARKDSQSVASMGTKKSAAGSVTFVVGADGSYEQK